MFYFRPIDIVHVLYSVSPARYNETEISCFCSNQYYSYTVWFDKQEAAFWRNLPSPFSGYKKLR
jgi:hypothetical protein